MVRALLLMALLGAGCRLYAPTVIDCQVRCGARGECPTDTTCLDGFCRTGGARAVCECARGDTRPCGGDLGVCATPGVQRCTDAHQWSACEGNVEPTSERCNGLDDDCNGVVDDRLTDAPACALTEGVCSGATQQCVSATFLTCGEERYGARYEVLEQSCDGLDNDCEGHVDRRASVELNREHVGAWWFLSTGSGFLLATEVDGGTVDLQWFDADLHSLERTRVLGGDGMQVATRGDEVRVARRSDGGVLLEAHAPDGGHEFDFVDDVGAFALSGRALAVVHGDARVELRLDDGGTSVLGIDDGGTLLFSELGTSLAWSGGLSNTVEGTTFPGSFAGYSTLTEAGDGVLGGLPRGQPLSGSPVFVADVRGSSTPLPLTSRFVPGLHGHWATGLARRALIVGVDASREVWLVTERGASQLERDVDEVRVAPGRSALPAIAWSRGSVITATRACTP